MRVSVYGSGLTAWVTAWALADVGNRVRIWPGHEATPRQLRQLVLGFDERRG